MTEPRPRPRHEFVAVSPAWWVSNLGGLTLNGMLACRTRSRVLSWLFLAGVATHVAEAAYAFRVARHAGIDCAHRWALQTLGVGFPSLIALHAVLREQAAAPSAG
jgi:hypothetical protein